MDDRLRAICDLTIPSVREYVGRHEYDGVTQDLSPEGVSTALARLGGPVVEDPHDEAQLQASEAQLRLVYGELQLHRSNPLDHVANLELAVYDRPYAPEPQRQAARRRHLRAWPEAIDGSVRALDRVAAPVARSLLPAVKGLTADLDRDDDVEGAALAAHAKLVAHLEQAAEHGDADAALGPDALARLIGVPEAMPLDLTDLAARADAERDRLSALLADACDALRPGSEPTALVDELLREHPDLDGVLREARALTAEVLDWTRGSRLVPRHDGECRVGPAPPSRRWAMAMMAPAAPEEPDGPSWYHVTPPDPAWPAEEQQEWLSVFSATTLPAITVHEVAPGHFTHWRMLRRLDSPVRRTLMSEAFIEGWAHYTEELCVDEGFRGHDPRYPIGVALEALIRVTRLAVSIGLHAGTMTLEQAVERFRRDALMQYAAARGEAERALFDPTYGRYTLGKLEILALRQRARQTWGDAYSHLRFHTALLDLGAPPVGLMSTAIERG